MADLDNDVELGALLLQENKLVKVIAERRETVRRWGIYFDSLGKACLNNPTKIRIPGGPAELIGGEHNLLKNGPNFDWTVLNQHLDAQALITLLHELRTSEDELASVRGRIGSRPTI